MDQDNEELVSSEEGFLLSVRGEGENELAGDARMAGISRAAAGTRLIGTAVVS
jgi:hypothetical protein